MYRLLSQKEMSNFALKYLPEWSQDIVKVSMISYHGTKEYLVNDHYLVTVNRHKVTHNDLQVLYYN